jgi:hypothetical protein
MAKDQFVELVRNGNIKSPTQKGFKTSQWEEKWRSIKDPSKKDEQIYTYGKIIDSILGEVRNELGNLYSKKPNISDLKLLKAYCAISNRDAFLIFDLSKDKEKLNKDLFSTKIAKTRYGNELTPMEIADACVDGFKKAISYCIQRIESNKNNHKNDTDNTLISEDSMVFVGKESSLSQIYDIYEELWRSALWGDYSFSPLNKEHNFYEVSQEKTAYELAKVISQKRKMKLHLIPISDNLKYQIDALGWSNSFIYVKKDGKKKKFIVSNIQNAPDMTREFNYKIVHHAVDSLGFFPKKFYMNNSKGNDFSLLDIYKVYRHLIILSNNTLHSFPSDSGAHNIPKLLEFCPTFPKDDLIKTLSKATGFEFKKTLSIFSFLTLDAKKDVWFHPIIDLGSNKISILLSVASFPNILRTFENWLSELSVDLKDKGYVYEDDVIDNLNSSIDACHIKGDISKAASKTITDSSGEKSEQIDIVFRIGNEIFTGECKSIVTTDSAVSYFNAVKILEGASKQAKRKATFLSENLEISFAQLKWPYDADKSYKVHPFILTSNRMHVGFPVDGVPVCDEIILCSYFKSGKISLLSNIQDGNVIDYAWFNIYSDFEQFKANLKDYLFHPPQLTDDGNDFVHKESKIPCIGKDNPYKILEKHLIPIELSVQDKLSKKYFFPLEKVQNIDEILSEVDFYF